MSSRRTLILMAAIAVGALAAFAIYSYVGGVEDRANEDARTVGAIRIAQTVPQGTPGLDARNQSAFEEVQIPQALVTGNEIDAAELAAGLVDGKVAGSTLVVGQILVEGMFVDPQTARIDNTNVIPDGNVAITISVDDVRGVAGLIVPGDFINMMSIPKDICTGTVESVGGDEGGGGGGSSSFPSYGSADPSTGVPGDNVVAGVCTPASMVYQAVQVLFVDRTSILLPGEVTTDDDAADGATQTTVNTGLLTLSVPVDAAQLIASLSPDSWYLTLLPPTYTPGPIPDFDPIIELWPGEDPNRLTPYGPAGLDQGTEP